MPVRVLMVAAGVAGALALTGCASARLLVHSSSSSSSSRASSSSSSSSSSNASAPGSHRGATDTRGAPSASQYLAQLRAVQQTLARAERSLPAAAPTPQALSKSVTLLAGAVQRLARGLKAITPPVSVARQHSRLIAIVRAYARRLRNAARVAVAPGGEVSAGTLLISATNLASTNFSATIAKIYSTLGVRRP